MTMEEQQGGYVGYAFRRAVEKVIQSLLGVRTWTPTVTQTNAATLTNTRSICVLLGPLVYLHVNVAVSAISAPSGSIVVGGLPFPLKTTANPPAVGDCKLYDTSTGTDFDGVVLVLSATTVGFSVDQMTSGPLGSGSTPALTLAAGDLISFGAWYERA